MDCIELWHRVRTVYARAGSYRDEGSLTLVFGGPVRKRGGVSATFRTAFVRSKGLLFDYRDSEGHVHRIRTSTTEVIEGREDIGRPIGRAIAAITGVTFCAAHTIPRLLWSDVVTGRALGTRGVISLDGEEDVDGEACHRLRFSALEEVLVNKRDFTIRRLRTHYAKPSTAGVVETARRAGWDLSAEDLSTTSTTTTTYRPEIHEQESAGVVLG
jgi:hypothetical protein